MGIGVLPSSQQLEKAGIQVENPMIETENQPFVEDQPVVINSGVPSAKTSEGRPQLFLAASGLPTVPLKLAQRIWELDFVEMEEFLPSNRTVQALEISGLAREGTVFQVPQAHRVADMTSWIWCFTLYVAVMAKQKPDLVALMLAHLHTVIKVELSDGGLTWLQYDWKTRKELCAAGSLAWGKQDPWQLLACIPHNFTVQDLFDVTPQDIRSRQPPPNGSTTIQGRAIGTPGPNQPGTPTHRGGSAGCSIELQQGIPMRRSVYSRTAAQYAGEQTLADVDARKETEGEVTHLDKEWHRNTVRHRKHYNVV